MTIYSVLLTVHNLLRWATVVTGLFVLIRNYRGWLKLHRWKAKDQIAGALFTTALDSQALIGLLLYFILSPITKAFFSNLPVGMTDETLRFFGVEHFILMIIAIAIAHYTKSLSTKDIDDSTKFKMSAILYSVTFFIILIGIPWLTCPLLRI